MKLPAEDISLDAVKWIGWEPNAQGKYLPKCASMASSMDPQKYFTSFFDLVSDSNQFPFFFKLRDAIRLAESGVYLNLKLMKWRMVPELDLKKIAATKCLLFGAGTLGCSVARNLIAWGIRVITFVDSGHVSYSNPVRQSLFRYDDAVNRREKAKTAAERLLEICPGIVRNRMIAVYPNSLRLIFFKSSCRQQPATTYTFRCQGSPSASP